MRWIVLVNLLFSFAVMVPNSAFAEADCSCPKVSCGPCQKKVTIGKIVKFCDWGDINVCRKVVCENVNFYFGCLSNLNKKKSTPKEDGPKGDLELVYEQQSKKKTKSKKNKKAKRNIASPIIKSKRSDEIKLETEGRVEAANDSRVLPGESYSDVITGEVAKTANGLKLFHRGQTQKLKKGSSLFVGDEIINNNKTKSKIELKYEQGSVEITLNPKSKLQVEDPHSLIGRFQPFLYLVHGGCEFNVKFDSGSFDLLAGQILTRTASGKQKVNYEMDQEGLKVKVESLENSIEVIKAQELTGQPILVRAGNFVSWVSETSKNLFSMDEKQALAGEGFITPVFQMPDSQLKKLGLVEKKEPMQFVDWQSNPPMKSGRDLASSGLTGNELCQTPAAQFQQCAWSCEGNPKGAKNCQAQKDNVHCVRRVCNAAGQWGTPTAFATSYRDLCPASGVRVGECSP